MTLQVSCSEQVVSYSRYCPLFLQKNTYEILISDREFTAISPLPVRKIPLGSKSCLEEEPRLESASLQPPLYPSGIACCPREFLKSPPGFGDLIENSPSKTRISYKKINCPRESDTPLEEFSKFSSTSR